MDINDCMIYNLLTYLYFNLITQYNPTLTSMPSQAEIVTRYLG